MMSIYWFCPGRNDANYRVLYIVWLMERMLSEHAFSRWGMCVCVLMCDIESERALMDCGMPKSGWRVLLNT